MGITIEELKKLDKNTYQIIDIRDENEVAHGAIPGAVATPADSIEGNENIDFSKKLVICCSRGRFSVEVAEGLEEKGMDAVSLEGGYIAWLLDAMKQEEEVDICKDVELSIRKKFRKSIWCKFTKAINQYELVKPGDRIAVCISGGKDSMLMAKLFQELKIHNKFDFEVKFLVMDPGYSPANRKVIEENARKLKCLLVSEKKRKKRSKGRREIVTKVGMCIMAVSIWFFPHGKKGEVEIVMLNVGQGDCFFVRGPGGGTYLIDGGSSSVKQVGKYRIETFLKFEGVGKLDYVWVSHGDLDHLNGIAELLERKTVGVDIENLVLPAKIYWNESLEELAMLAQSKGTTVLTMAQGERVMEEQMQMQCLWGIRTMKERMTEEPFDENQFSTVLSLEYGDFSMLFTGDLEKEAEESVASYIEEKQEKGEAPKFYEILKVGHHGSKNGTGEHLLTVVNPVCAWVSAGEGNRYGHPSQEVVERLAKWEVNLYNTKDGSAVKLCTDGRKYCILRP